MIITEILKHGRENATRADELAAKLETTPRGLRSQIMRARDAARLSSTLPAATADISCQAMTRRLRKRKCRLSITSKPPGASMD